MSTQKSRSIIRLISLMIANIALVCFLVYNVTPRRSIGKVEKPTSEREIDYTKEIDKIHSSLELSINLKKEKFLQGETILCRAVIKNLSNESLFVDFGSGLGLSYHDRWVLIPPDGNTVSSIYLDGKFYKPGQSLTARPKTLTNPRWPPPPPSPPSPSTRSVHLTHPSPTFSGYDIVFLTPNKAREIPSGQVVLNQGLDFSRPGIYKLTMVKDIEIPGEESREKLESNALHFEIVAGEHLTPEDLVDSGTFDDPSKEEHEKVGQ